MVFAPENTLQRVMMSPSDLQDIQRGYPFVLTTEDDRPVQREVRGAAEGRRGGLLRLRRESQSRFVKNKRYLLGRIWVDATDLQIVVTNGRMVPDDTRKGNEDLHPPFMTWRQQVDGHYWFPVYTKGEGILHFSGGHGYVAQDVHMRDTIKYTDYKRFGSTVEDHLRRAGHYSECTRPRATGAAAEAAKTRGQAVGAALPIGLLFEGDEGE